MLLSTLAAIYAGGYVGKRFLRNRISAGWVLVLTWGLALVTGYLFIITLGWPVEYVLWVAAFIGSIGSGAIS